MPQKLSERPEELVRQFLVDNIDSTAVEGYDPQQTDSTQSDFLPVTNDWSDWGDYYPVIVVQETDGPTVPNSGNTNFNGQQGNGSGPNQYNVKNITLSCQAVEGQSYRNSVEPEDLTYTLYQECHHQIQNNATTAISEALFIGVTPSTQTRSSSETDSGSTETWIQRQGTITMGVLNTP